MSVSMEEILVFIHFCSIKWVRTANVNWTIEQLTHEISVDLDHIYDIHVDLERLTFQRTFVLIPSQFVHTYLRKGDHIFAWHKKKPTPKQLVSAARSDSNALFSKPVVSRRRRIAQPQKTKNIRAQEASNESVDSDSSMPRTRSQTAKAKNSTLSKPTQGPSQAVSSATRKSSQKSLPGEAQSSSQVASKAPKSAILSAAKSSTSTSRSQKSGRKDSDSSQSSYEPESRSSQSLSSAHSESKLDTRRKVALAIVRGGKSGSQDHFKDSGNKGDTLSSRRSQASKASASSPPKVEDSAIEETVVISPNVAEDTEASVDDSHAATVPSTGQTKKKTVVFNGKESRRKQTQEPDSKQGAKSDRNQGKQNQGKKIEQDSRVSSKKKVHTEEKEISRKRYLSEKEVDSTKKKTRAHTQGSSLLPFLSSPVERNDVRPKSDLTGPQEYEERVNDSFQVIEDSSSERGQSETSQFRAIEDFDDEESSFETGPSNSVHSIQVVNSKNVDLQTLQLFASPKLSSTTSKRSTAKHVDFGQFKSMLSLSRLPSSRDNSLGRQILTGSQDAEELIQQDFQKNHFKDASISKKLLGKKKTEKRMASRGLSDDDTDSDEETHESFSESKPSSQASRGLLDSIADDDDFEF